MREGFMPSSSGPSMPVAPPFGWEVPTSRRARGSATPRRSPRLASSSAAAHKPPSPCTKASRPSSRFARPVRPEDLVETVLEDPDLEALEIARRQVAARLAGRQQRSEGGTTIVEPLDPPPHPDDPRVSLAVGRLGGAMVPWPREMMSLYLSDADGGADTDLVSLRVSLKDQALSWTQLVPFDPSLPASRDTSILRDYLGARGVLAWIRDVLDSAIETDGGGAWDAEGARRDAPRPQQGLRGLDLPAIEQVLRAWVRDPSRLDAVDCILSAVTAGSSRTEDDPEARTHLQAFLRSWKTLRAGLIGGGGRVR
jgi:hypothetical protein